MNPFQWNPLFEQARRIAVFQAELETLSESDQQQVRLLATETTHTWASALEAVKAGDYRRRPVPVMPRHVASITLPPPRPARGRKLSRAERRKRK